MRNYFALFHITSTFHFNTLTFKWEFLLICLFVLKNLNFYSYNCIFNILIVLIIVLIFVLNHLSIWILTISHHISRLIVDREFKLKEKNKISIRTIFRQKKLDNESTISRLIKEQSREQKLLTKKSYNASLSKSN